MMALPLKGQDSPRAELPAQVNNNGLEKKPVWPVTCNIKISFPLQGSETCLVSQARRARLICSAIRARKATESIGGFMALIIAILDFFLGCHHDRLSRVFTLQGETYKVCFDCGAKFAYSLHTMSIERRMPS